MKRISIPNPDFTQSQLTSLDSDYTSGITLTVINNVAFSANDYVVVGEPGSEKAELKKVTGITNSDTIDIASGLNFDYAAGTPVYRAEYNAVEISYNDGTSWSVLSNLSTLQVDQDETVYIHDSGTDSYSYRFRYRNVAKGIFSDYSATLSGAGFSKNQIGKMIENVRRMANDTDRKVVSDDEIISFLNIAKDIVQAKRADWWFWQYEDTGTITTVADQRKYNLDDISTTIEYVKDVRYRDASSDDVEIYHIEYLQDIEFDRLTIDEDETADDTLSYYTILPGDSSSTAGYISVDPPPETTGNGSFYIRYYQPDTDFDDVGDTTAIPLPYLLEHYAVSKIEQIKGNDDRSEFYEKLFKGPGSKMKDVARMSGLALLEQMQRDKLKPTNQPQQLKNFRGRNAVSRLYKSRLSTNIDSIRERYF